MVPGIDGALEEDVQLPRPAKLKALKGRYSQGQDIMGRGFELTAEERGEILAEDARCAEVIFPLYNGQDLNTMPKLEPYRWVIYFRDWPEEKARRYGPAFRRVKELVKPYRESLTGQIHQDCFWKFWDLRPQLVAELERRREILASAITSKYLSFRFVPTSVIMNKATKLYFFDSWREFACLQSSLHSAWAYWTCGMMGLSTLKYSTSEALETWPMPSEERSSQLEVLGKRYHALREDIMANAWVGLTQLYNRAHDPAVRDSQIEELRALHREIDLAVACAYGWDDLDLAHDFRDAPYLPDNDRVRFTISEPARTVILRRLAELNRVRYEEEVARGLHGSTAAGRTNSTRRTASTPTPQPAFDFGDASASDEKDLEAVGRATRYGGDSASAILRYLTAHRTWNAKADILSAIGLTDGQWNIAIADLVANGLVERQGERRGTRYRAKSEPPKSRGAKP